MIKTPVKHPFHGLRRRLSGVSMTLALAALAVSPASAVNWFTQHGDVGRDGANLSETVLTPTNVNTTNFGMAFRRNVDGEIYAAPARSTTSYSSQPRKTTSIATMPRMRLNRPRFGA
jgi:hypothetical protein